jgi:Ca-activated chloride channel family protein
MFPQALTTSIGFEEPQMLLLIPASTIVLLFLYVRSREKSQTLARRLGKAGGSRWFLLSIFAKFATAVLMCVVAAQPYVLTYTYVTVTPENILYINATSMRLVLLVDISKSMGYTDTYPSRISNAVELMEKIIATATSRGDYVDVYVFSDIVEPLCISLNSSTVDACMAKLRGISLKKYSAIGDAFIYGYMYARASRMPAAILVITDGAYNYGSSPLEALQSIKSSRVPVALILVGNDPRSHELEQYCRENGIPTYRVSMGSGEEEALRYVSERLYSELKFEALVVSGQTKFQVPVKDYTVQLYLLALLVPLFILSLAEGL